MYVLVKVKSSYGRGTPSLIGLPGIMCPKVHVRLDAGSLHKTIWGGQLTPMSKLVDLTVYEL